MPVGEAHTADILELGRRGFVEIDVRHDSSPVMLIASPSHAQIRSRVSHSGECNHQSRSIEQISFRAVPGPRLRP